MTFAEFIAIGIIILLALQVLALVDIWMGHYRSRVLRLFSNTDVTQYEYTDFSDEENDTIKWLLTLHILFVVFFGVVVYYYYEGYLGLVFIVTSWIPSHFINKRLNAFVKDDKIDKSRS